MQIAADTGTIPAALALLPVIDEDLGYICEAFNTLSPSRASGMGLGAIPLSEVVAYLQVFPVFHSREFFVKAIREMDFAWLAVKNKRDSSDGHDIKGQRRQPGRKEVSR